VAAAAAAPGSAPALLRPGAWAGCTDCGLAGSRTQVVAGAGDGSSGLMLVADAPGLLDDRSGAPLAGPAGDLLDELLAAAGLERAAVALTQLVKCRTPGGRDPAGDELAACRGKLDAQIAIVRPRVLCPLGTLATRVLTGRPPRSERGQSRRATLAGHPCIVLPLHHPGAALYNRRLARELAADLARVAALLGAAAPAQPAAAAADLVPKGGDGDQLGLF
jgi:uracil-DNA glycosylase